MEFNELIQKRRSIRAYEEKAVDHDSIVRILTEAQQAPSWKNMQCSRVYAVESPEMIAKLSEQGLPPFNQKSSANAALLVTTFVKDQVGFNSGEPANEFGNHWGAYDLGLRDSYLILAAAQEGLATLIMGIRDGDAIRSLLGIPEDEVIGPVIALGYPAGEPADRPRKPLDEVTKFF